MIEARYVSLSILGLTITLIMGSIPSGQAAQPTITVPLVKDSNTAITIDGIWTTPNEWNKASEMIVNYTDGTHLVIRGQHDSTTLFVLLEMPDDTKIDGRAAVCFDNGNQGGTYMSTEDMCYLVGSAGLKTYNGDGITTLMQETALNAVVSGERGLSSGRNSPYGSGDHVTYEFKIPLKVLGDHVKFGFYVTYQTSDPRTNVTYYYSFPNYKTAGSLRVASPRDWGHMEISALSVVPEFPISSPAMVVSVGIIISLVLVIARNPIRHLGRSGP